MKYALFGHENQHSPFIGYAEVEVVPQKYDCILLDGKQYIVRESIGPDRLRVILHQEPEEGMAEFYESAQCPVCNVHIQLDGTKYEDGDSEDISCLKCGAKLKNNVSVMREYHVQLVEASRTIQCEPLENSDEMRERRKVQNLHRKGLLPPAYQWIIDGTVDAWKKHLPDNDPVLVLLAQIKALASDAAKHYPADVMLTDVLDDNERLDAFDMLVYGHPVRFVHESASWNENDLAKLSDIELAATLMNERTMPLGAAAKEAPSALRKRTEKAVEALRAAGKERKHGT